MDVLRWLLLCLSIVHTSNGLPSYKWEITDNINPTWTTSFQIQQADIVHKDLSAIASQLYAHVSGDRRCRTDSTGTCLVSVLFVPSEPQQDPHTKKEIPAKDGWIYASTIPRGEFATGMKLTVIAFDLIKCKSSDPNPLVWWDRAQRGFPGWKTLGESRPWGKGFHSEDGCYYKYETSGRAWFRPIDQQGVESYELYPKNSRIATWGKYGNADMSAAKDIPPCGYNAQYPSEGRDPSCKQLAGDLGVAILSEVSSERGIPNSYSGRLGGDSWKRLFLTALQSAKAKARQLAQGRKRRDDGGERRGWFL